MAIGRADLQQRSGPAEQRVDTVGRVLTRPSDLADDTLTSHLRDGWGVGDATVDYLAVGFGSHHWLVDDGSAAMVPDRR